MRKVLPTLVLASGLAAGLVSGAAGAAVPGYEALYTKLTEQCTIPNGIIELCRDAITAYSTALIAGGVDLTAANASFTAVRAEVFAVNAPQKDFQVAIDGLFEELLPDSGDIGPTQASATQ